MVTKSVGLRRSSLSDALSLAQAREPELVQMVKEVVVSHQLGLLGSLNSAVACAPKQAQKAHVCVYSVSTVDTRPRL